MTSIHESGFNISRRRFLAGAGGLTFCVAIGTDGVRLISEAQASASRALNAWVRIAPDGVVTILSAGAVSVEDTARQRLEAVATQHTSPSFFMQKSIALRH